jgi:serine/threonine protein kinase
LRKSLRFLVKVETSECAERFGLLNNELNETISPNTMITQYTTVSKIAAGGMGELCSAHDSRLNRGIAVKLLPADFANHEDRLRQFEQEAKATSALNHPIILIYDSGEHFGAPVTSHKCLPHL